MPKIHISHSLDTFYRLDSQQSPDPSSALPKTTLLFPCCILSSIPNSLYQHSTIQMLTTLSKLIPPKELLQLYLSPYILYRGIIHVQRQLIGTAPLSKYSFNSLIKHSHTVTPHFFQRSTGKPSWTLPKFHIIHLSCTHKFKNYYS